MQPVVVVGAGIAGVAAARAVVEAGLDVVVLDRGRKPGGRMASRHTGGRMVDTGASYFTASDPAFVDVVEDWRVRGLARPWTDTFHVAEGGGLTAKPGPTRWAATGGLRSLIEDLAAPLTLRQTTVASVTPGSVTPGPSVDGLPAAAVLLAMPDPQAQRLLDPTYEAELAQLDDPYEPVLALTAIFDDRSWPDVDGVFVADDPVLSWVADDGRRRGDQAPVLVAHSTPEFARSHLDAPDGAEPAMVEALREVLSLDASPAQAHVHRWTYARPTGRRERPYFLGDAGIGLCGDGWHGKSRVEAAYLSGHALGVEVAARLGTP